MNDLDIMERLASEIVLSDFGPRLDTGPHGSNSMQKISLTAGNSLRRQSAAKLLR